AERNPVPDLRGALKTPVTKHRPYLQASELPAFLKKLASYDGHLQTELALRFLLLTFVRTAELRGALWRGGPGGQGQMRLTPPRAHENEQTTHVASAAQATPLPPKTQNFSR